MSTARNHTFSILPLTQFANKNSQIRRPQEITHFSYDTHRRLHHDQSSLKSYYEPKLGSDLSRGFESFQKHDSSIDEHLDGLLEAIVELEKRSGKKVVTDIITWRGMMTKFMALPYNTRDGFEMNAIKFQDTIFIEENHSYRLNSERPYPQQDIMTYWGYKFEELSTLPCNPSDCSHEEIESRDDNIVNNEAQFCSIVKTGFGGVRMVIGGEVDAVLDQNPPSDPLNKPPVYVELKTSKSRRRPQDYVNYERKMLRFWAQSFLLGIAKIVVGFRSQDGILEELEEMDTTSIPGIAKRSGRHLWDGKVSIDFTTTALEWIKQTIETTPEGTFWRIVHAPGSGTIHLSILPQNSFLSPTFLEWRNSM
ncbi:RAI1-domain-containing protein [Choiromyces venosus 120613-1]|uniref:Decapping nuclease n=1 Tax=Choiromyces venosus 120613-1 TaxID=1336337 RepID=A0A3N4KBH7_9PEZI|nr:RAI1-domain-containing protein [Choiromyces venosus 120613-1]